MNQERFDELTKGLATGQLSRGQVLKGLAASLAFTLFPMLSGRRAWADLTPEAASVNPSTVGTADANIVTGSCQKVFDYINQTGVLDAKNERRLGQAGWTVPNVTRTTDPEVLSFSCKICKRRKRKKTSCTPVDCNEVIGGVPAGTKLEVTTNIKTDWFANPAVSKVTWVPDPSPCPDKADACKAATDAFHSSITQHEDKHVSDVRRRVKEVDDEWASKQFIGSGENLEAALKAARAKWDEEVKKAELALDKRNQADGEAVHKNPFYAITLGCGGHPCDLDEPCGSTCCGPGKSCCNNECLDECSGGQRRNPSTCKCEDGGKCHESEAINCGTPGSTVCKDCTVPRPGTPCKGTIYRASCRDGICTAFFTGDGISGCRDQW